MGLIKFGAAQISNPTPASINLYVRVFTVTAAVFLGWISTASIMGPHTKDVVTQILGLALALTNGLAPLFGVEVTARNVPTEDVKSVEVK